MEPNVEIYCRKEKNVKKDCSCLWLIVGIIAVILSFFIGLLVGATTGILGILTVGILVSLVIILVVLLIISIINVICCKKYDKKKNCC